MRLRHKIVNRNPFLNHDLSIRHLALAALVCCDPADKVAAVRAIPDDAPIDAPQRLTASLPVPGRPAKPDCVPPAQVPRRAIGTPAGRAALLHAIAHIEFNAINLALDALWRFEGMPPDYYRDWLIVAKEEAYHFTLLQDHLATLGHRYGDFPAHEGLWQMAERTQDDVLARMALVPRTLEARGLDASPAIRDKLIRVGDEAGAAILDIILRDEIGHVAIGNRWYRYACAQQGLAPLAAYPVLAAKYDAPRLRGPFNLAARRQAGFDEDELAALDAPRDVSSESAKGGSTIDSIGQHALPGRDRRS
ncbi:ferritin-like domain-containing protein [Alcaligenaceae bacterium A4P071]|nr:ferritin-like domain-containing protein [Alcaligenaceae bacterium A4P071]